MQKKINIVRIEEQGPIWDEGDEYSSFHFWEVHFEQKGKLYMAAIHRAFYVGLDQEWIFDDVFEINADHEIVEYFAAQFFFEDYNLAFEQLKGYIKIQCGGFGQSVSRYCCQLGVPKVVTDLTNDLFSNKIIEIIDWDSEHIEILQNNKKYKVGLIDVSEDSMKWILYKYMKVDNGLTPVAFRQGTFYC
ncbi:hypothetical protein RZN22_18930 [Bacillaceae bacterium S4-13-58]